MGVFGSKFEKPRQDVISQIECIIKHLDSNKKNDKIIIENRSKALQIDSELKKMFDQVLEIQKRPKTQPFRGLIGGTYSGEWSNGQREGVGEFTMHSQNQDEDIKEYYIGNWKNDKQSGFGATFYQCNEYYIGQYKNGKPNGQGTLTLEDGSTYEGQWVNGEQEGFGVEILKSDGWIFKGNFRQGQRQGKGTLYKEGMYELEGIFEKNDFVNGVVKYLNQSINVKEYKGAMKDGKFEGSGELTYRNKGQFFKGQFLNHQKNGNSQFCLGQDVQLGQWENDRLISV